MEMFKQLRKVEREVKEAKQELEDLESGKEPTQKVIRCGYPHGPSQITIPENTVQIPKWKRTSFD